MYLVLFHMGCNILMPTQANFFRERNTFLSDYFIDITDKMCPMTFVKTKLLVERMEIGQTADVRLRDGEPLANVPRALREIGQEIVALIEEEPGIWRLTLKKAV